MGVYIKGMKMPTSCDDCFLPLRYCPYAMKPNGECPLVPVPPHGDLIERDVAFDYWLCASWDFLDSPTDENIRKALDATPTIIPAEDGE